MIIGKGMLARAFASLGARTDLLIFASGVSNSLEIDDSEFAREFLLLESARSEHPDALLVYFSTCSIADTDRSTTPYVQHKVRVEAALKTWGYPYICLRLPAVIGPGNVARTLPFYLRDKIISEAPIEIWSNARRFTIDVEDVVAIGTRMIEDPSNTGSVINLALRSHSVLEMVEQLEKLLGQRANVTEIDRGSVSSLDLSMSQNWVVKWVSTVTRTI